MSALFATSVEDQLRQRIETLSEEIKVFKNTLAERDGFIRSLQSVNRELVQAVNACHCDE